MALPEASEKLSHGEVAWFVGGRQFANTSDHHHDDRLAVWCAVPPGLQEILVKADPVRFFRPPYVGHRGWLGIYLDVEVDWDALKTMIEDAYRQVAPKGLRRHIEKEEAVERGGEKEQNRVVLQERGAPSQAITGLTEPRAVSAIDTTRIGTATISATSAVTRADPFITGVP